MVWKQIIQYVETKKYKDLILITDDNKEDWWWKKRGKTYGPHKSLIEELKKETTVEKFWMYNSLGFLENAKIYLKANIKDNTIETVKEVITSSKRGKLNKLELPEYYIPILSVLFESEDGKLTVQECIEKVEPIVKDKLQEDDYEELMTFKPSVGLGFKIGAGIVLQEKYTISLNYLGLGSHKVKYEYEYEYDGESESDDDKFDKALSVSSLNITFGIRF